MVCGDRSLGRCSRVRQTGPPSLWRPIVPGCLQCHASIAAARAGNGAAAADIVNPRRLDAARHDRVCAPCHLSGEFGVPRAGRRMESFSAGERLSDYISIFVRPASKPALTVAGRVESLAQSTCRKLSGDSMWCGSCHDPHERSEPQGRDTWYRAKCFSCHDNNSCNGPKAPAADAQHVVMTDHSIPRRPRASRA